MFKGHCVGINVDPIRTIWLDEQASGVRSFLSFILHIFNC